MKKIKISIISKRGVNVCTNSYYHWLENKERTNKNLDHLKSRITKLFHDNNEIYGSTRIKKMLEREGFMYSISYVGYLMNQLGLKSVLIRKFVRTTDSNHNHSIAKNTLNREFTATGIGQKWVSDITYVQVGKHWNYLTTIIDLADRKIVGWSLSNDMTTENTVYKAWIHARNTREIKKRLIFHSDRGVQYTSTKIVKLLNSTIKVTQSMSRKGNCWDNAVAESFFKTIKYECFNRYYFTNSQQLYKVIEKYIRWYNTKRIHSALDYRTPLEMELKLTQNKYKKVA